MLTRLQRMLTPVGGYLGGGGSSGGGGGGGGGSTVSDREFEGAIAQDTANRQSGGGGVSYGNSGYVGSGGSSADVGGQPAPAVFTANDGSIHTTTTARDARNAEIAAQAKAQAAFDADFASAQAAEKALEDAYGLDAFNITGDVAGGIQYSFVDPYTGETKTVDSTDQFEGLLTSSIADQALRDKYTALAKGFGQDPEQIDIVEVGSIADKGFFNWLADNVTGNADSDLVKVGGAIDLPNLVTGSQFKIDEASGALVRQTGDGAQDLDIGMYLDYTGLGQQYDTEDFQNLWTDDVIDIYGDNSLGFQELAKDKETLEQAVSGAWLGETLDTLTFGLTDFTPEVQLMPNGQLGINDPLSMKGIAYNLLDTAVNSLGAYATGGVVGDILYGATGEVPTALIGAKGTEQIVKFLEPLDNQVFLGIDGKTYLSTSYFGGEANIVALDDAINNVATAKENANQMLANDSGSGDSFNMSESLQTGISSASRDTAATGTNWRDYYKLDVNVSDVIGNTLGDAFAVSPEVYKGIEFAQKIDSGEDIVDAAIQTYGDKIVDFLPEGYDQPTEAAIRIATGEDRVSVLGDVYGQDLGLDNPLGKASIESLNTYDQTGDTNKALVDGIVTYVEEGGELPDFKAPDYIANELDFDLPDIDFGGIAFGDLPDINLPEMIDLDLNIGSIDFSGVPALDLGIDLADLPSLDINAPDLDWSGVDVTLPEVNLPQLGELGVDIGEMDWSNTNIGSLEGIDLPNLDFGDLEGLAKGTVSIASVGADRDLLEGDEDLFSMPETEVNRLSQKLLNAKLV